MPSVPSVPQGSRRPGLVRQIFGLVAARIKAAVPVTDLSPLVGGNRGWFSVIGESFTGAWQRGITLRNQTIDTHYAVYSCITLIASDISKMCIRLVEQDKDGIWNETTSSSFSPVLRKPNRYQNRIKFIENWVVSKLRRGNTYVLKGRDARGVVTDLYVLDPDRCRPLVTPSGDVYYQLSSDNLAGIGEQVTVPASEIIHDTMVPLFHPLVGVSPLVACGMAAFQGLAIQAEATRFFENGALPGGILTVPGDISDDDAAKFKKKWEENYSGQNAGRVAVLGGGLKYERMAMTMVEAQLIEQLKWTAETICSCFHVPAYMIGVGAPPVANDNVEARNQQYYSQCLQAIIENIELLLDEGLGLTEVQGKTYGTEFDLDGLLRMDTATMIEALSAAVKGSIMTPNTALKRQNLAPVAGGDTIYMQQQNYSLEALSKRDAQDDPFGTSKTSPPAAPSASPAAGDDDYEEAAKSQIAAWEFDEVWKQLPPIAA